MVGKRKKGKRGRKEGETIVKAVAGAQYKFKCI